MKIEIRMAIMSHLSDAQELITMGMPVQAQKEINFAKYLMIKYKYNLNQEIDEEQLYLDCCDCNTKGSKC